MTTTTRQPPNHDTLTCYSDYGCRLPDCVDRYRAYERARYKAQAEGTWQPFVDAEPVRAHLQQLYAKGVTIHQVAMASGLTYSSVRSFTHHAYDYKRPRRQRVTRETADKLLAITPDNLSTGRIDCTGTRRRIHALVAIGWPLERIAPHAGLSPDNMTSLTRRDTVLASTARAVAAAYEQLRHQQPAKHGIDRRNITRAKNRAAANRWAPPSYWADRMDVIDDPHFEPMYGITRGQQLAQDARWLMREGTIAPEQAAARLGITVAYLHQALRRYPELEAAA